MTDEELKARIAEIEQGIALYKQIRALEIAGMQSSVVVEMARAVPDGLMRDIVKDFWKGVSRPSPMIPQEPVQRGSGWVDPGPLRPPPGVELIDRMMAVEDRQWRAERARQFGVKPPAAAAPTIKRRV
jgi:hypothetical protein